MTAPTPLRPAAEVVGAYVSITLAGKEYRLRELPSRVNRDWQKRLATDVRERINAVGPMDSADEVIQAIADSAEVMMDLLIEYDRLGTDAWNRQLNTSEPKVLPEREVIDTTATDRECYEAMKKVTNVSFPFGGDLLRIVPEFMPILLDRLTTGVARGVAAAAVTISSRSTSSSRRPTGGSPTTSNAA